MAGSSTGRGSNLVAYVGLLLIGIGAFWGLLRFGYVDVVTSRLRSATCGVVRLSCPAPGKRPGNGLVPTGGPTTAPSIGPTVAVTPGGTNPPPADRRGASNGGRRPASGIDLPWPLIGVGAALFALFWWDVPRRLRNRFSSAPKTAREERRANEIRRARLLEPGPGDAPKDAPPAIAGITPGIAAKGMRVAVRTCEITLRPGADGAVVLEKTHVGTGSREFAAAGREVRRYLRDPGFVAALIEETGRAAAYVDGNPQLAGAVARGPELRSLLAVLEGLALEGAGDGQPR